MSGESGCSARSYSCRWCTRQEMRRWTSERGDLHLVLGDEAGDLLFVLQLRQPRLVMLADGARLGVLRRAEHLVVVTAVAGADRPDLSARLPLLVRDRGVDHAVGQGRNPIRADGLLDRGMGHAAMLRVPADA